MSIYKFLNFLTKPWMKFLYPTEIVHAENFPKEESCITICNHYATPDTFIIAQKFMPNELHVLAKAEAFDSKIGNKFLKGMGAIPVHRGEGDVSAVKSVMKVLKANKTILIFPEGTRNKAGTKTMAPLKQGVARFAIKSNKKVVPMMYYRMHKVFRKNWLMVGEPIAFDNFKNMKNHDDYQRATDFLTEKMAELRTQLDAYVEDGKKVKKGKENKF